MAAGRVAVQSAVAPELNVTVPRAPGGSSVSASVALVPACAVSEGEPSIVILKLVAAGSTVSVTEFADLEPAKSPPVCVKVATMSPYSAAPSPPEVVQELAPGSVNEQSVVLPETNVTVPCACSGSPASSSVAVDP